MKGFVQTGDVLTLKPTAAVSAGIGFQFGTGLFGVAVNDVAANADGAFICEGVVDIAKTAGLAVSAGDRVFWDSANKVVNKTVTAQQCVGICVSAALAGDATVRIKLGHHVPSAT